MIESPTPGATFQNQVHQAPIRGSAVSAGERPADFERLAQLVRERADLEQRWVRRLDRALDRDRELTEEERQRLRALGYLGS